MDNFWLNFALEIGFLSLLGVLYYFYQKRKIIRYEENKIPMVMGYILQLCLSEKTEEAQPKLDTLIEALDDFLNQKTKAAPFALLRTYADSPECPKELKDAIVDGLKELE